MRDLVATFPFTAFVETGTYRGYSSELIAISDPALPIFTSEIYEPSYSLARAALSKFHKCRPIWKFNLSICNLLAGTVHRRFSLFFLGRSLAGILAAAFRTFAHFLSEHPRVVVIDDFEVPGQPQFEYDIDGGGRQTEGLKCNLEYITSGLLSSNTYQVIFPKYSWRESFGMSTDGAMRGHVVIFQMRRKIRKFSYSAVHNSHYFGMGKIAGVGGTMT